MQAVDHDRYSRLIFNLKSQFAWQANQFPSTLDEAFNLLVIHDTRTRRGNQDRNDRNDCDENASDDEICEENSDGEKKQGMAFVQNGRNRNGNNNQRPTCFLCGEEHYLSNCLFKNIFKNKVVEKSGDDKPNKEENAMVTIDDTNQDEDSHGDDGDTNVFDLPDA